MSEQEKGKNAHAANEDIEASNNRKKNHRKLLHTKPKYVCM